jgi:hypothetical protein
MVHDSQHLASGIDGGIVKRRSEADSRASSNEPSIIVGQARGASNRPLMNGLPQPFKVSQNAAEAAARHGVHQRGAHHTNWR